MIWGKGDIFIFSSLKLIGNFTVIFLYLLQGFVILITLSSKHFFLIILIKVSSDTIFET